MTEHIEDEYWTERLPFFTAQFPTYFIKPQQVHGRFHTSDEQYTPWRHEIIPLKEKSGRRTYVLMQPYVLVPELTFTFSLYDKPKHYADQDSAIGKTIGQPRQQGFREVQVGNAQAWYYPADKTIVVWECFFDQDFHKHPLSADQNMQNLWRAFEQWLLKQFPHAKTLATPFNDPSAESIEEYQSFLQAMGYSRLAKAAFGKSVAASIMTDV
jgi:hypothetical protein